MARGVAAIVILALLGCGRSKGGRAGSPDADWTLLVYMAADDNLERAAIINLQEMAELGSDARVNVVVQIDRGPATQTGRGFVRAPLLNLPDFHTAKRLRVDHDRVTELADVGEGSTGDPQLLADFVSWGVTTFPARKIALVLWDHGGATAGFAWDFTSGGRELAIGDIAPAIAKGLAASGRAKLDVIGFDACLMGTVEIAYELRGLADVFIASEEVEPAHGWAYAALVEGLRRGGSAADLGTHVVGSYQRFCAAQKTERSCTMAAIELSKVDAVAQALDALGAELVQAAADGGWMAMARARAEAEEYGLVPGRRDPFGVIDAVDFAEHVPASPARARAVTDAVHAAVIASSRGPGIRAASGLSISFPPPGGRLRASDASLAFARLGRWQALLAGYVAWSRSDTTAPTVADATARAIPGTRAYDVNATVTGADVDETLGIVAYETDDDQTVVLSQVPLAAGASGFRWDQALDMITDGHDASPVTLFDDGDYTDAAGRRIRILAFAARIVPADGDTDGDGDDDRDDDQEPLEVTVYAELPDGGELELAGVYQLAASGEASEVELEAGDRLEPLLYGFDDHDDEVWIPSGDSISLADLDDVELVRQPAPAGTYRVGILAIDLAGNQAEQAATVVVRAP